MEVSKAEFDQLCASLRRLAAFVMWQHGPDRTLSHSAVTEFELAEYSGEKFGDPKSHNFLTRPQSLSIKLASLRLQSTVPRRHPKSQYLLIELPQSSTNGMDQCRRRSSCQIC